jgi:hypothetical protein
VHGEFLSNGASARVSGTVATARQRLRGSNLHLSGFVMPKNPLIDLCTRYELASGYPKPPTVSFGTEIAEPRLQFVRLRG